MEFHKGSMTKEDATLEADKLIGQGRTTDWSRACEDLERHAKRLERERNERRARFEADEKLIVEAMK